MLCALLFDCLILNTIFGGVYFIRGEGIYKKKSIILFMYVYNIIVLYRIVCTRVNMILLFYMIFYFLYLFLRRN